MRKKVLMEATDSCGIDFWTTEEQTWVYLIGLLVLQVGVQQVLTRWGPFKTDAALFAHQVCSMFCILHCSIWGIYFWYGEAGTVEDRMYGPTEGAKVIGRVNLAFQFYDLLATIFVARLRKVEMLVHHALASVMSYLLLRDCYVHWYAIFYLGISEVSSIPLAIVDVFKYFPHVAARFSTLNTMLRLMFALLFIVVRGLYWPTVSARHLYDTFNNIQAGEVHSYGVMAFCTLCNFILTLMQWYWSYLIVRAAVKMMSGTKREDKKAQLDGTLKAKRT